MHEKRARPGSVRNYWRAHLARSSLAAGKGGRKKILRESEGKGDEEGKMKNGGKGKGGKGKEGNLLYRYGG